MTYKQAQKILHKRAAGELGSALAGGAYTLAALLIATAGVSGAMLGYFLRSITRPRKQDKLNILLLHRNNRLKEDINRNKILIKRLLARAPQLLKKKAIRVFA